METLPRETEVNFAADALWWKLTDPQVRALAGVLLAPPLYGGDTLSVRMLLGDTGFRRLLALDQQPDPLYAFAHGYSPENLLEFWLSYAPHAVLRRHFRQPEDVKTVFEADLNGITCRVECCFGHCMVRDGVAVPCGVLSQETGELVSDTKDFSSCMHSFFLSRGTVFLNGVDTLPEGFHAYGWRGGIGFPSESSDADTRYAILTDCFQYAPVRVSEKDTCACAELPVGMAAALERRLDGFWHEVRRFWAI